MATFTSRAVLRKPATSDNVDVTTDLNDNFDQIDQHLGYLVCTSSTRPTGSDRFTGRTILETDTGNRYYWTGTEWFLINDLVVRKTADQVRNNSSTLNPDNHLLLSLDIGTWEIETHLSFGGPTAADFRMDYTFSGTFSTHRRYTLGPAGSGNDNANTIVILGSQAAFNAAEQYAADIITPVGHINEKIFAVVRAAGSLRVRWGQNTGVVGDTTVYDNSYMRARRLA
jgi:hypothetical protein